jgi:hypothetical protein
MRPWLDDKFANPHSPTASAARRGRGRLAREQVARGSPSATRAAGQSREDWTPLRGEHKAAPLHLGATEALNGR